MPKLTYEQMRQLSEVGDPGKLQVKNRRGEGATAAYVKDDGDAPSPTKMERHPVAVQQRLRSAHYGEPFPDLPSSFILLANTASGKTVVLLNYLLRYYKDAFPRIWFFCPVDKARPSVRAPAHVPRAHDGPAEGAPDVRVAATRPC